MTAEDRQPTAPRNTVHVDELTTAAAASNRTDGKDGGGEQKQTVECRATAKERQPSRKLLVSAGARSRSSS